MFGEIQSPNFPDSYPSDSEMTWNISVPDGFRIKLYFMHFDLESSYLCEYDYVKVEAEDQVLATFCGRETTDTEQAPGQQVVLSPSSYMGLTFRSDFSNEERFTGFDAHYTAVDVDECLEKSDEELACDHNCHNYIGGYYCSCRFGYILHSDNRTCKVECSSNLFTQRSGVITSADFPSPYPKSSDCLYRIELEEGFLISLQFEDSFDIEDHPEVSCPYDYIKIKAGRKEFGPFCGEKSPGRLETQSNSVQILFHSDSSGENQGWKLSYTAIGNPCPLVQPPINGKIEPSQAKYTFKDQVVISCNTGYNVLKDNVESNSFQIECLKDGTWSNKIPICKSKKPSPPTTNAIGNYYARLTECNPLLRGTSPARVAINYTSAKPGWLFLLNGTGFVPNATVCGQPVRPLPGIIKRIIGGRNAEPGFFPWQALIVVEDTSRVPNDKWFGSGALLSDSWVLTAAHVLRSQRRDNTVIPVSKEHVTVYLGLHDVRNKKDAINRTVEEIILHRGFDIQNYNHDIALVKLKEKVTMDAYVMPVCLPQFEHELEGPHPNTLGLVAGWGISNPNITVDEIISSGMRTLSDILQYVKLPVVLHAECKTSYESRSGNYSVTENMFCAGYYEGGKDTCLGDSGGAFVIQDPGTQRCRVTPLASAAPGLMFTIISKSSPPGACFPCCSRLHLLCAETPQLLNSELAFQCGRTGAKVCGKPKFSRSLLARISNGRYAQRGVSPWIAMLYRGSQPFCGGSLLGTKWIVTAAHCLHQELELENPVFRSSDAVSPSSFSIILGKHRTLKQDDTEQQLQPKNIIIHPSYRAATFEYDIGLVELSEQAVLNDYIEIPLTDHALCQEAYARLQKKVTDDMICAGEKEGGKDACSGDSGGPMVTISNQNNHWQLIGTVSWGDGCGQNDRYGVYSSVPKSLAWIKQVTGVEY
ncbi:Mannan-binding lectin serine protease 1 [Chelonia mydas]|uniref:Mannan-binding lectin serine protease 1 n=1 Tax=Chelonia mydas TaxID=8469 RepID=M7BI99_CHEMY|nr:Mannan-binding lectin serine protease 1 [Chelonia mydas]